MITTCPFPVNLNPLSPNGFEFSIKKLPELTYFSQEVTLPSINLPNAVMNTRFSQIKVAGTLIDYGQLVVDFLVDEKMENYLAIHDWIIAMGFPHDFEQYISWQNKDNTPFLSEIAKNFSDGTLTILGSNNTPIRNITFVDLIPVSLGEMQFKTTSEEVQYLTCSASFEYTYFKFD